MNSKLTSTLVASLAFVTLSLALSCSSGNQNLADNQNAALGASKPTPTVATTEADPCGTGTPAQKLAKVKPHLAAKIAASNGAKGLNYLVNVKHLLSVDIVLGPGTAPTYLQLHIGGYVGGHSNFLELINLVEKVVKSDCTAAVIFDDVVWANGVPPATPATATRSPSPAGTPLIPGIASSGAFVWTHCEEGTIPCGGACCPYPLHGDANKTADANMNSNSNSGNNNSNK